MNRPQRIVLAIGALAISLMALFPPWIYIYSHPKRDQITRPAGYHSIFGQHVPQDEYNLAKSFNEDVNNPYFALQYISLGIDQTRLGIQILTALLVMAILLALLRSKQHSL